VARFAAVLGAAVFAAALVPARRAARESIVELIGAGGT
jgi:ABC-type antimicrobial peptide transport system permease subunit